MQRKWVKLQNQLGTWRWKENPVSDAYQASHRMPAHLCFIKAFEWAYKSITVKWENSESDKRSLSLGELSESRRVSLLEML